MTVPEKVWLGCADADNEHQVWADPNEGGTEYTRADLVPDRNAIWNEAIEAAERAYLEGAGPNTWGLFAGACKAIRALKRQQGGNEA